jgi:tetratricopeptide (TPR) repeat protein
MRLTLTIIARDEEAFLPGCLASVRGIVDEIVLVDTGSTDRTREIARAAGARVLRRPWRDDFAWARNEALRVATGDWILFLDRVHEQILPSLRRRAPDGRVGVAPGRIEHLGYRPDVVAAKDKRRRNLELLRAEAASNPDDPFLETNLGMELLAVGRHAEAVAAFAAAESSSRTTDEPWHAMLYKLWCQAHLAEGDVEAALRVAERGLAHHPRFTDLLYLRATARLRQGDLAGAEADFRRCLALGPAPCPPYSAVDPRLGLAGAAFGLGGTLTAAGRTAEGIEALRLAASLEPGWLDPAVALVAAYRQAGLPLPDLVAASPPPHPLLLAAALVRHGDPAAALLALEKAEAGTDTLPPDHGLLKARLHLFLGDATAAEAALGAVPADHPRRYVADLVALAQGRLDEAALSARYPPHHPIWSDVARLPLRRAARGDASTHPSEPSG